MNTAPLDKMLITHLTEMLCKVDYESDKFDTVSNPWVVAQVIQEIKDALFGNTLVFEILQEALVDGDQWYTVRICDPILKWLYHQNKNSWYRHKSTGAGCVVDVEAKLFTLMSLTFIK
jgi:hypothetical protein